MTEWIGAAEAADRLGIKPASLYAYVSRGLLARRRDADGRGSLFDATEVEQLATRGRPRRSAGRGDLVIESALTEITDTELRYRGLDATMLAREYRFEDVAGLLWLGAIESGLPAGGWQATPEAIGAGSAAQAALPPETLPLERLQVIVPALAATDQLRLHLDQPAVVAAGQAMIAGMVACLPSQRPADPAAGRAGPQAAAGSIASRLAVRLCTGPEPPGLTSALQSALVLLADHEFAASTLAARVAASMCADPYAVVATGLGALGGSLHGGAELAAEVLLSSAADPADAPRLVGELLRRGERLPGFGHFVYKAGDPRALLLFDMIEALVPGSPQLAVALAITGEARRRALPEPNIDFALATLTQATGLIRGAGEAIFATARVAGWLAHALEEYERNTPIRPRSVYTGP